MSQQSISSSFPVQRVRMQPLPENGQRNKPRPLTEAEKLRLERNRANRAKTAIEDQQYQSWIQKNSDTYRQITGEMPPIPSYCTLRRDLATVETMAVLSVLLPPRNLERERSTTDKFNLKMIPPSVFLDYRIDKDGRNPRLIRMCYIDMLKLLNEGTLIQGCYRGRTPIIPDPTLAECDIVIEFH